MCFNKKTKKLNLLAKILGRNSRGRFLINCETDKIKNKNEYPLFFKCKLKSWSRSKLSRENVKYCLRLIVDTKISFNKILKDFIERKYKFLVLDYEYFINHKFLEMTRHTYKLKCI